MVGKCRPARMVRANTVPSPMPASNRRSAGGRVMLASSMPTLGDHPLPRQVVTNSKITGCRAEVLGGAGRRVAEGWNTDRGPFRQATARAYGARTRSTVSVVTRPLRNWLTSLPSFTASRPNVDPPYGRRGDSAMCAGAFPSYVPDRYCRK
jgi:hypothetical protein